MSVAHSPRPPCVFTRVARHPYRMTLDLMGHSDRAFLYLYQHQDILSMTEDVPKTDAGKAREGLIDELKTINHYEEMADESKDPVLKRQFEEIVDDEKVHVGNFAEMIADKDKKAEPLMREGLEEARKLRKSMFYSFREMMGGASHFEKKDAMTPEENRIRQAMEFLNYKRKLRPTGGSRKIPHSDDEYVNIGTRNADISAKRYPYSRAQLIQAIATGAARPLTYGDIYNDPRYTSDDDISYDYGPDGVPYVVRWDRDDRKFHQIIRKEDADGRVWDLYMTPRNWEHYHEGSPALMTYDWAVSLYKRYNDKMSARPRTKERNMNAILGGRLPDEFTSPLEKEAAERGFVEDTRSETESTFDTSRNRYADFNELANISGVLAMPPKVFDKLKDEDKAEINEVVEFIVKRIPGFEDVNAEDFEDPETANYLRKFVAEDIYNNPKKYVFKMPKLLTRILDKAKTAMLNSDVFYEKWKKQRDKNKRNATASEYADAEVAANQNRIERLTPLLDKSIQYIRSGHDLTKDDPVPSEEKMQQWKNDIEKDISAIGDLDTLYSLNALIKNSGAPEEIKKPIIERIHNSIQGLGGDVEAAPPYIQEEIPIGYAFNSLKELDKKKKEDIANTRLFPESPEYSPNANRNPEDFRLEGGMPVGRISGTENTIRRDVADKVVQHYKENRWAKQKEKERQAAETQEKVDAAKGERASVLERSNDPSNFSGDPASTERREENEDIFNTERAPKIAEETADQLVRDAEIRDQNSQRPAIFVGSTKDYIKSLESNKKEYDFETIARGLRNKSTRGHNPRALIKDVFLKKGISEELPKTNPNDPTERPRYHVNLEKLKEFVTDMNENATDEQVNLINAAIRKLNLKGEQTAKYLAENLIDRRVQEKPVEQAKIQTKVKTTNDGADSALIGAKSPGGTQMSVEGQAELGTKSSDFVPPEEDISGFGQGEKLSNYTGSGIPEANARAVSTNTGANTMKKRRIGKSASFREMLKSATAKKWEEKGLPSGSLEKTLPAYYRTVTMGCDKDAINVYEHQKMSVGGKGISMKKVPGIGPKMSTKGDE